MSRERASDTPKVEWHRVVCRACGGKAKLTTKADFVATGVIFRHDIRDPREAGEMEADHAVEADVIRPEAFGGGICSWTETWKEVLKEPEDPSNPLADVLVRKDQ